MLSVLVIVLISIVSLFFLFFFGASYKAMEYIILFFTAKGSENNIPDKVMYFEGKREIKRKIYRLKFDMFTTVSLYAATKCAYFLMNIFIIDRTSYVYGVSLAFYHLGSSAFYAFFLLFSIQTGFLFIKSSGKSESESLKPLKSPSKLVYCLIISIYCIQFVLSLIRCVLGITAGIDYVETFQLVFHTILGCFSVFIFILVLAYAQNEGSTVFETKPLSWCMYSVSFVWGILCIFSFFIKVGGNLALSIIEIFEEMEKVNMVFVNVIGAGLDLFPLILMFATTNVERCLNSQNGESVIMIKK
eukprot:gene12578-6398_t